METFGDFMGTGPVGGVGVQAGVDGLGDVGGYRVGELVGEVGESVSFSSLRSRAFSRRRLSSSSLMSGMRLILAGHAGNVIRLHLQQLRAVASVGGRHV